MQKQLKELSLHPTDPSIRSLRRDITVLALISLLQIATSLIFQLLSTSVTKVDYSVPASFQRLAPYLLSALEMVSYFFILFLPIFLISVFLKYPLPYKKIRLKPVLPPYTPLMIGASTGVLYAAGYVVNKFIIPYTNEAASVSLFSSSIGSLLISFLSAVILPAILEEVIYRGIFLQMLLPYGKAFAVITSGLLFGIMHLRFSQLFYATVAGILIGYFTVKGGSLWIGVLIHFTNNLLSFSREVIRETCGSSSLFMTFDRLIGCGVLAFGAVSVLLLIRLHSKGSFTSLEPHAKYEVPLSMQTVIPNCLTPPMVMYLVISVYMMYSASFSAVF